MGILSRFTDILSANVNSVLDRAEDPAKMIDKYLRDAMEDLAEVKKETAEIIADEKRAKRSVDENTAEVEKYLNLAKKALAAGNDGDAKVFLEKKQSLEAVGEDLSKAYMQAHDNAEKMRELHDKLTQDISSLKARRDAVIAKTAVAKTQEKINKIGTSAEKMQGSMGAFQRMEEKADKMMDAASAAAELEGAPKDSASELEKKYSSGVEVDSELEALKKSMGL